MIKVSFRIALYSLLFTIFAALPSLGKNKDRHHYSYLTRQEVGQSHSAISKNSSLADLAQVPNNAERKLDTILDDKAKLEKVASGFKFVEGPLWHPRGFLIFSDVIGNTIYRLNANKKVSVFRRPSQATNGNTLDPQGRLISARHDRRIVRTEKNGKIVTLASRYNAKRLNSPNDVVVKSDGSIYFTDPPYGILAPYAFRVQPEELGFYGVYRLNKNGKLTLLVKDFVRPNGIAFSPDEKKLYVNDTEKSHIRVFDVKSDGTLSNGRIFAELKDPDPTQKGGPDGMKVDLQGNVYTTGPGGIWIFSPSGELLGRIALPEEGTNLGWGDRDYKTLYITAGPSLYRIRMKMEGVHPGTKINR